MTLFDNLGKILVRRGFFWQSAENYGKISGFYDYGPLGSKLKQNIIDCWRSIYAQEEEFLEIETPSITPYEVFKASGHIKNFVDAVVKCMSCKKNFRADQIIEDTLNKNVEGLSEKELDEIIKENKIKCPKCNSDLSNVKNFNLMFETKIGPEKKRVGYLRPETAQGIFIIFNRLYQLAGKKLPFGAIQIGKGYRNEISPRQGMLRLREFTMLEAEIFLNPDDKKFKKISEVKDAQINIYTKEDQIKENENIKKIKIKDLIVNNLVPNEIFAYYLVKTQDFLHKIGIENKDIRFRQQLDNERAHYSLETYDCEVRSKQFGWVEVAGHAYRSTYDLTKHDKYSEGDMKAYIKYENPKKSKETKIEPNFAKIGKTFKSKSKKILKKLKEMDKDIVISKLNENNLIIDGEKIEKDMININEEEVIIDGKNIIPAVYEPSYGLDRCLYLTLEKCFREDKDRKYFKFKNEISPIAFGVFPIVSKDKFIKIAKEIHKKIKSENYMSQFREKGSIGRRYAKSDEIGIPYCITVDSDTKKSELITIRDRNSKKQVQLKIEDFFKNIHNLYQNKIEFESLGKVIK